MITLSQSIEINGRHIGQDKPPYIIGEMSGNHNGDIEKAKALVKIAKESGVDAIKLQTYTADTLTLNSDKEIFKITEGPWKDRTLYELYEWAHTPWEWHKELFDYAKELNLTIFSSPFDETAVDFLEELGVPAYKVASFELTDLPLVTYIAKKKKPMILSTGMASLEEIHEAIEACYGVGNNELIILHCVSGYPTPISESNLETIQSLRSEFGSIVGLSDHTLTNSAAIASVALGARVIEKHFIDSRQNKGPDSDFSLEPDELKSLCLSTKEAFSALGQAGFEIKKSEKESVVFRRSLIFSSDLKVGEKIEDRHVRRIRPGYGIAIKHLGSILGKKVNKDIEAGTPVSWDDIESGK